MRRAGAWIIVAGALASGCSGLGSNKVAGPNGSTTTTASAPESSADDADSGIGSEFGDVASTGLPGPDDLPLPGLLDASDESVPNDDEVRAGTLDNGLAYYIRFNDNPGAKAELRLAIDAGSVDEFGSATGTAHFLEHMLFNGTERFPENELVDTLRSFGAAFGADVNARTGYDSTVYQLTVPNADETVELGLTVLEQWLSHATIEPDQVVAERGVVLDEWRVRTQSAHGRQFEKSELMFLADTPYFGRSPIGTDESISAMDADELRAFYDRWYRPDNAAVVVVGDIDVDGIESDLVRLFGAATSRTELPVDPPEYTFPIDLEPDAYVHADPDQQTTDVEVTFPLPMVVGEGTAAARVTLLDLIAFDALVRRLDEDISSGVAPFDQITGASNSFVDALDAPGIYAFTDADRVDETLDALLDEIERVRRFGFTQDDLDVARDNVASFFQTRYDGRESNQDRDYAEMYVSDFLGGDGYPSIETEYEFVTDLLDGITTEALDLRFRTRLANTAPHVVVATPENDAERMPPVAEILATAADVSQRDLAPRAAGGQLPDALMDRPPAATVVAAGDVVDAGNELFAPVRVEFENGVTVIVNSNDIVEGQVFFQGASRGGLSLVADGDVIDGLYAADVVTASGVAEYNASELDRILAGTDIDLDAWIQPYSEHLAGRFATSDIEELLQYVHLLMSEPRVDAVALRQVVSRVQPGVDDPSSDARLAADDALLDARYPDELRYASLPTPEQFATLDLEGVRRVWTERFGNAGDFTFVFSGDLDVGDTIDLAAAYLGSLPSGIAETPLDVSIPPPPDVVRTSAVAGTGDTASLTMLFTSPVDDVTASLRTAADVATELMSARLIDVIREELGDSYSPSASSYVTLDPEPVIETYVSVTGAPDRVGLIGDLVAEQFVQLADEGPTEQEFASAFATVAERYRFVNNWSFVTELLDDAVQPELELDDYLFLDSELPAVDARSVQDFLAAYVPADRYIEVTVTPK